HSGVAPRRILGHTFSPADKPWTLSAGVNSRSELVKIHDLLSVTTINACGESQSQRSFHGRRSSDAVAATAPDFQTVQPRSPALLILWQQTNKLLLIFCMLKTI